MVRSPRNGTERNKMTYLLNLLYISLYSIQHQEDLFLGISISISISHTYGVAEPYANPIL